MDAFEAKEQELIDQWGQMDELDREQKWSYYTDSLRVADGLTLSVVYQVEYEWIAPEGYQLPEDQKADLSGQGLMRYWDFQDILLTGSIWMGGPAPENDPVMEVEIYCEGTGFGEDTGPIQAQETARCSYRPAQEEYSTFTAGGEVLGQSWVVDLVYLLADPKFLDEAGNKSYSWSGSCSWTDENGQTQTQELSIM